MKEKERPENCEEPAIPSPRGVPRAGLTKFGELRLERPGGSLAVATRSRIVSIEAARPVKQPT